MTPAAEALLARVYGITAVTITPAAIGISSAVHAPRLHPFNLDRFDRSRSSNLGIPRPCYGLAEDCHRERHEWRGN